jgi:hypothetical protein
MTAPNKAAPERYGNTRVSKVRGAYNDPRSAVRSGDLVAAQGAFDRYEPWADYVFDKRHSPGSPPKGGSNSDQAHSRTAEREREV